MLLFLPCYRTNRSVTCGSQSMKLISHDFDNSIAFLTDTALFPSWDGGMSSWDSSFPPILSVRLPSSLCFYTCPSARLCCMHFMNVPYPQPGASGGGEMRLRGSVSLLGTCSQAWAKNQSFHLNRETADRCAIFTSGYWEVHSCVWPPTHSFLHLQVGEGTHSFVALVFLSAWGRSCSWEMLGRLPGWGRYFLKSGWAGNWVERLRVEGRHPCVPGLLLIPLRVCERKHKLIFIQTTPITPLVGVRYTHSSDGTEPAN